MQKKNICAIIWDYDGTLVETRNKNYNVTKAIIQEITEINPQSFSTLASLENYIQANDRSQNWRDLYRREFNLNENQIDRAGSCWTEYQLKDNTPVFFYEGIKDVISMFRSIPQGIVSQNSKNNIMQQLKENNLTEYFRWIVGYEEVDISKQKPYPDGLVMCIEKLTDLQDGIVVYIGDHDTDVRCAENANISLKDKNSKIQIITVGALYKDHGSTIQWNHKPDFIAEQTSDIIEIVRRL